MFRFISLVFVFLQKGRDFSKMAVLLERVLVMKESDLITLRVFSESDLRVPLDSSARALHFWQLTRGVLGLVTVTGHVLNWLAYTCWNFFDFFVFQETPSCRSLALT